MDLAWASRAHRSGSRTRSAFCGAHSAAYVGNSAIVSSPTGVCEEVAAATATSSAMTCSPDMATRGWPWSAAVALRNTKHELSEVQTGQLLLSPLSACLAAVSPLAGHWSLVNS